MADQDGGLVDALNPGEDVDEVIRPQDSLLGLHVPDGWQDAQSVQDEG